MKLSIITINYNNLAGLRKTVASVLAQTWRDFEWIIVDGGSTDGSKEYIEQLAQGLSQGILPNSLTPSLPNSLASSPWRVTRFSNPSYTAQDPSTNHPVILSSDNPSSLIPNPPSLIPHLSSLIPNPSSLIPSLLWCSEPDKGIYNAMNKGIQMASGEYLNFMNSGDCFYESDTLEKVFSQDYTADIVYGDWIEVRKDSEQQRRIVLEELAYTLLSQNVCHQALFLRTKLLKLNGYNQEKYGIIADWASLIGLVLSGRTVAYYDCPICKYDMYGMSSQNVRDLSKEYQAIVGLFSNALKMPLLELKSIKEDVYVRLYFDLIHIKISRYIIHGLLKILSFVFK